MSNPKNKNYTGVKPAVPKRAKHDAGHKNNRPVQATPDKTDPETDEAPAPAERIAKRLARAGLCSRREAERWIGDGRVVVNGVKLTTPAFTVSQIDNIEVDGKPLPATERTRLWLFHKPSGLISTNADPEGRKTIFQILPQTLPRVLTVGRLDINTEGLLLLTNDGGLARMLELPSTGWLRKYRVRAHGKVDASALAQLKEGVAVEGVLYGSIDATIDSQEGSNSWLTLALREGKNREVKNVLASIGLVVNRLIRVSYGPFQLGDLAAGEVREIRGRTLRDQLGEKLIASSNANFDAPIVHHTPDIPRSEKRLKQQQENSTKRKKTKMAKGQVNQENLERLTTKSGKATKKKSWKISTGSKGGNPGRASKGRNKKPS